MQIENKDYNPELHERHKALVVRQPYADLLVRTAYVQGGERKAEKQIEVRSRKISYRGDILICAARKPEIPGRVSGACVGLVELYDCKPVAEFTEEDWANACLDERPRKGYGWMFRNPRRVVEMPVKGILGLFTVVMPKNDITLYPEVLSLGKRGLRKIKTMVENAEIQSQGDREGREGKEHRETDVRGHEDGREI